MQKCIVLDIEGTTTPISFVTDVLFPYARDNVRKHLISTFDNKETKEDIELLRFQVSSPCHRKRRNKIQKYTFCSYDLIPTKYH